MDRREFLKATGAAAAATTAAASAAAAAEGRMPAPLPHAAREELRLAVGWDDGVAGPPDWAHRLARSIGELSGGRWHVTPAFSASAPADAVRAGDADLCFDTANALLGVHRGFAYFAGLPGDRGLSPRDLHAWVSVGGGQALWDDLAGDLGLKPLLAAHTGSRSLLLASRTVGSMAGLAGRRAYAEGLSADVARGLGFDVVSRPRLRLADAMARGELEVAEVGGAIASYALQLVAAAPYDAGTSINRNGTAVFLGVRRSLWDRLGAAEQAMLAAAASGEYHLSLAEEEAHRHLLYPAPAATRVWPIAAELDHAVRRVAAAVVAHAAGTDALSRRISDSYAAFRRTAVGEDAVA